MSRISLICGVVDLTEVVPDARILRDDVRLIAAAGDHVVGTLLQPEVFATEIPADVHQLHGIEGRSAAPRGARGVGAFTLERVLDRHEAGDAPAPPSGR